MYTEVNKLIEVTQMNIHLNYYEQGQGFPLILLHGNGEDMTYFKHQIDVLSEYYRVFAVETRGHGRTPRGDAPFTIRQFADDLLKFMDEHQIDRAHLLGYSDGGNIAMCFAIKYPHRVGKLILNGANLYPLGVKLDAQIPITIDYYKTKLFGKKNSENVYKTEMLGLMVNDPYIKRRELKKLSMPALVIAGTEDLIRKSHIEKIAKIIPNAELAFVYGGHAVAYENPYDFNAVVLNFLNQ